MLSGVLCNSEDELSVAFPAYLFRGLVKALKDLRHVRPSVKIWRFGCGLTKLGKQLLTPTQKFSSSTPC